jgi:hypothetical protein
LPRQPLPPVGPLGARSCYTAAALTGRP